MTDARGIGRLNRRRTFLLLAGATLAAVPFVLRSFRGPLTLPPCVVMWIIAFGLFAIAKTVTWRRAAREASEFSGALCYFLLWPGMDPLPFARSATAGRRKSPATEWWFAGLKALLGLGCLATASMHAEPARLWVGWLGMIGLVLLLHFGLFHLLALGWQAAGRDVKPIMNRPLAATSLNEFWGSRWNNAFSKLANDLMLRPLSRRVGVGTATALVFLFSGLVHELVISVPAGGGYGLPTAYFVLQAVFVRLERQEWFRRLGFGAGVRGWLLVVICVGGPAFWLFHPQFVFAVILPMLRAIGSI